LSPLLKIEKPQLPQSHKDSKVHKDIIFNDLALVQLRALVPSWQKEYFSEQPQISTFQHF
jgi:hypothetical protein